MPEVPPGPPEQLPRLERYRQEHPDVDIQPPGAYSAVWCAYRDGDLIAYGFTLMVFLDRLEALPEPLGTVQDFGLHSPARNLAVRLPGGPQGRGAVGTGEPPDCVSARRAAWASLAPGRRVIEDTATSRTGRGRANPATIRAAIIAAIKDAGSRRPARLHPEIGVLPWAVPEA